MYAEKVDLSQDEKVLFDRANALLTNERLLLNWHKTGGDTPADQVLIRDVAGVRKIVGGQERRLKPGLQLLAGGVVVGLLYWVVESFTNASGLVVGILFIGGAIGLLAGVYVLMGAALALKPRTTLLFVVFGSKDLGIAFPGHANPDAEELARLFNRLKNEI